MNWKRCGQRAVLIPSSSGRAFERHAYAGEMQAELVLIPSSSGRAFERGAFGQWWAAGKRLNPFFVRESARTSKSILDTRAPRKVLIPSSSGRALERGTMPNMLLNHQRLNPFFVRESARTRAGGGKPTMAAS